MELVWFTPILAGELLGPVFMFPNPTTVEVSGEKNPVMGSIPNASRWPVSLTVRPVFLDFFFRQFIVFLIFNFVCTCDIKGTTRQSKETHRPATPISATKLFSRDFAGGTITTGRGGRGLVLATGAEFRVLMLVVVGVGGGDLLLFG